MAVQEGVGFGDIRIQKLNVPDHDAPGRIANISHGAIHVKVRHYLSPGSIRVWFSGDCHRDGELIFCHSDGDSFRGGVVFPPDPVDVKRSELRVPLTDESAIIIQLEGEHLVKRDAQALDISRSGLGLLMDQPLAAGSWVKVELAFAIVFGEVLYSKAHANGGYRLGLRIETLLMRDGRLGEAPELTSLSPCVVN